jgi:osmoprotectant transport system ATP-binding protein
MFAVPRERIARIHASSRTSGQPIVVGYTAEDYPGGAVAVDDLSLEVPDRKIMILAGPSGCGKTTTLRMVNRLVEPTGAESCLTGTT